MLNTIRKLLAPPIFEGDEEKTRIAGLLSILLQFIIIASSLALPPLLAFTEPVNRLPLFTLVLSFILAELIAYSFMRRGQLTLASAIFLLSLGISILGSYAFSELGSTGATLSLTILIAFTTLLLGARAIFRLIIFIIVFTFFVVLAQRNGWVTPAFSVSTDPISIWISNSVTLIIMGLGLYLSSVSLRRALDSSLKSRASLQKSNQELADLQTALEQRVQERTAALELHAAQLETVSHVARAITSVQDLDQLLPDIAKLVSDRFGFYHVGIFLVDEANEYAVLRASNSAGGVRMLHRQHRLRLDSNSIVGFVTSRNEPRVALDVGADSVYFNNPDLPNTRSEMALPLRIGGQVIGALDVQSTEPNAFSEDDVAILTVLADQVAIAIENARLFGESTAALAETEKTFERYIRQQWVSFASQVKSTGYLFDGNRTVAVQTKGQREKVKTLVQTGRLSLEKASSAVAIPIKLRGQTIGFLEVNSKKGSRQWTRDEITLLEAAADRAALTLENARLVETAQRRASRESAIGELSARIGAVTNVDAILQMAVEELGRKISGAMEVTIELGDGYEQGNA